MNTTTNETAIDTSGFSAEIARLADGVYAAHPQFLDLREEHPWLTGSIGDPFARVWFVAEIPSHRPVVGNGSRPSPETQWTGNRAAILFREMLVQNGFKTGGVLGYGGWNCYVTNVMKHAEPAEEWKAKSMQEKFAVVRAWAPVLKREFELGSPELVVALGDNVHRYLDVLFERGLVPTPKYRMKIHHYSYIGTRAGKLNGQWLGPMDPQRVAGYNRQFQDVVRVAASL